MDTIISPNEQIINLIARHKRKKVTIDSLAAGISNTPVTIDKSKLNKTQYKTSEFNFCQETESGMLVYNTLYNTLVRLRKREYSQYKRGSCYSPNLKEKLVRHGLWVAEALNERSVFLRIAACHTQSMRRPLSITITTTLKCNAHCPYCYEHGVEQYDMPNENVDDIIKFIKSQHPEHGLHITWFGGEPLMNTLFIDKVCERLELENLKFESSIISNGSLFTDEIIQNKRDKWKLKNVQITLDGTRGAYEKIKRYDDPALYGYDTVVNNIKKLAECGINVCIRMNICRENIDNIQTLAKNLECEFAQQDKVVFYPAFLTGTKNPLTEDEMIACVRKMFKNVSNPQKLTSGSKFYSAPRSRACNNFDPRAFTIDVSGNIFTCEHHVGIGEKAIGNIQYPEKANDQRGPQPAIKKECKKCVFLPKCFGGCQANRDSGDIPCFIEKFMLQAYLSLLL